MHVYVDMINTASSAPCNAEGQTDMRKAKPESGMQETVLPASDIGKGYVTGC